MRKLIDVDVLTEALIESEMPLLENIPVSYLYHATSAESAVAILNSGKILPTTGPQISSQAQTQLPVVCMSRSWEYATGKFDKWGNLPHDVVFIFDRNTITTNFRIIAVSQSKDTRGSSFPQNRMQKRYDYVQKLDANKNGRIDPEEERDEETRADINREWFTAKAGGEFEENVIVKNGYFPLQKGFIGFWINPNSAEALNNPSLSNNPNRLQLQQNRFVKVTR